MLYTKLKFFWFKNEVLSYIFNECNNYNNFFKSYFMQSMQITDLLSECFLNVKNKRKNINILK